MIATLALFIAAGTEWPCYANDPGGMRYAQASQITKANVGTLKSAWIFHSGEKPNARGTGPSSNDECTPIMVDGTLFLSTPKNQIIALDPDTGEEKWRFDAKINTLKPDAFEPFTIRGVSTWKDSKTGKRRIFFGAYDARLVALDAKTGRPCDDFGQGGMVDLREELGPINAPQYTVTSPPAIIGDLVVIGSCIADNELVDSPSGIVRAFDARTGKERWAWDPLGRADRTRDPNKTYLPGSANAWSIISADPAHDMLLIPTGSQAPDFYGGLRPGNDACADSVTAVQASTGKQLWTFQAVHHDIWDYDVPAQPILATVKGKPAVIVLTKMGNIFVLDRMTGKPIFPIKERPVPASDISGEQISPTQPFPVLPKPVVPQKLEEGDVWALNSRIRDQLLDRIKGMRNEGIFTPPSLQGTIIFPGNIGGCNWSGGSFNPITQTLYLNTNRLATMVTLIPTEKIAEMRKANPGIQIAGQAGAPYGVKVDWLYAPGRIPGTKPPWGTLNAIDLKTGKQKWEVPLGTTPSLKDVPGYEKFGSVNLGGSCVTKTGLVFIAAAMDETLRAFDGATGKVLWQAKLPAGGNAAPMTYISAKTGKQYVVICAGGHHGLGTSNGDSVVAYALKN